MFERADQVGGLASAWSIDTPDGADHLGPALPRHPAVRLEAAQVLDELGLDDEMQWVETKTGYFAAGELSSVSNTVEFLRLPGLRSSRSCGSRSRSSTARA